MRLRLAMAACLAMALAAACADILHIDDGTPRDASGEWAIDGTSASEASQPACNPDSPFGTPVALDTLNTGAIEQHPRLSPDELAVYFQRVTVDGGYDLFRSSRADVASPFAAASPIDELNTPSSESDISVTPDGLRAFFTSNRPGGVGSYDIWQASRDAAASPFGAIAPVSNVNSTQNESMGYYVPGALYFASSRGTGGFEIYRAAEQVGGFTSPLLVTALSSPADDGFPVVTRDELRIYFASTRGDTGSFQPYTATRAIATAPWGTPTLVTEFSNFGNALPAWISPDGCRLYLSSDHGGNYDMYVAAKAL